MLHDLIKAANRNLAPGADPEADWLKYADDEPCCITREEMEDAEFIELEDEDEYEEVEECDECDECDEVAFATLETTVDEIGYDETFCVIADSEVVEEFIINLGRKYDRHVSKQVLYTEIQDLPFIEIFESPFSDDVTVEVEIQAFLEYLDN